MKKFEMNESKEGMSLFISSNEWLFHVGKDIHVKKKGIYRSYIDQQSFNYEGMENVLIGRTGSDGYGQGCFMPKHIVVIQMN